MKRIIIHKDYTGYVTECGRSVREIALSRRTWPHVTCKSCLRCKPKKKVKKEN